MSTNTTQHNGQNLTVTYGRGYLSITGDNVNNTVKSFLPEPIVSLIKDIHTNPFHITLATKDELRQLKNKEDFITSCKELESKQFISLGIGGR